MQIHVKALTGNIITLEVERTNTIPEILSMVQRAEVLTPQQTIAINILFTGVVHGGLRLVSQGSGIEYHSTTQLLQDCFAGRRLYKVVLKKQFNDALQPDDMTIVMMLQDQYKAGV
jgi:hypothetical protein